MKKNVICIAVIAMFTSVMMTSCGGSKQTGVNVSDINREIVMEKKKQELARVKMEGQLRDQLSNNAQSELVFCMDEAMDKRGEYMGGLGISSPQLSERESLTQANRAALSDITTRFLGVIKNGVMEYGKDVTVPSNLRNNQTKLEGEAMSVGEKAINKYAEIVCRKFVSLPDAGTYKCYCAVHVPMGKVLNEVAGALEVAKVDYDAEKFRQWMQKELDAQSAANNAKLQNIGE